MRFMAAAFLLLLALPAQAQIVIAHRGASGERPEHTLAAYERAIDEGADYIELDVVPTKDGHLVARHESEISGTTDVAIHPEFAARMTTRNVDGTEINGWFTEDFTLAELKTLRAKERMPGLRPGNALFDGLYQVPSLEEVLALVRAKEAEKGRRVGLYIELKHPSHFKAEGFDTAWMLLADLKVAGIGGPGDPVIIQCFEVGTLMQLRSQTPLMLVQLIDSEGGPADQPGTLYSAMLGESGLRGVRLYADGVGLDMELFNGDPVQAAAMIGQAKAVGLAVHVWTLRRENRYLPPSFRLGKNPDAPGDFTGAWAALKAAGAGGVFTDNPASVPRPKGSGTTR